MEEKISIKDFDSLNKNIIEKLSYSRENEDFHTHLSSLFESYKTGLKMIDDSIFQSFLPNIFTKEDVIKGVKNKTSRLLAIYTYYSTGRISTAIRSMEKLILQKDHMYKMLELDNKKKWYRARILDEAHRDYSPIDMFHVPFQLRHLVKNYRYSISGYPCLYIGKTVLTCWEEMHKPSLDDFSVNQFIIKEKIKVLDLTLPESSPDSLPLFEDKTEDDKKLDLYCLLLTWPLIIACSIPVKFIDAPFKPEYVIPQLLMQSIQKDESLYGIAYTSTRRDCHFTPYMVNHMNIALPTRKVQSKGHCEELKSTFYVTRGVPYMEAEIMNCFQSYEQNVSDKYKNTKFYQLEQYLSTLPSDAI